MLQKKRKEKRNLKSQHYLENSLSWFLPLKAKFIWQTHTTSVNVKKCSTWKRNKCSLEPQQNPLSSSTFLNTKDKVLCNALHNCVLCVCFVRILRPGLLRLNVFELIGCIVGGIFSVIKGFALLIVFGSCWKNGPFS